MIILIEVHCGMEDRRIVFAGAEDAVGDQHMLIDPEWTWLLR